MPLRILLDSSVLKELLKAQLKKYKQVEDIIVFGSAVKGKSQPKDIDLAIIMDEKNYNIAREIYKNISKLNIKVHTTVMLWKELYTEPLWKSLIAEGFSIKEDKEFKDVMNINPVEIFSYTINKMNPSEKTQFNRKFKEVMKSTDSFKIGPGSVVVPEMQTGKFNDFFNRWDDKASTKTYRALLL